MTALALQIFAPEMRTQVRIRIAHLVVDSFNEEQPLVVRMSLANMLK
jgi:hypothetical protein